MLPTRFWANGLDKCLKFFIYSPRTISLFPVSMDSVKRKLEEENINKSEISDQLIDTNKDDSKTLKKLKTENEETARKYVHKALEDTNKFRKPKKVVLLLSYLGKNYFGMQRNSDVNTVEEELFKALLKTKVILQNEFDSPKTMKFQRAARTDKGVSAVRNIVSLKIPLEEISDSFPEKINLHLPPEVRVIALKRVTQSFDAKIACDARTYSYMLPTFAFAPTLEESNEEYRITGDRIQEVNSFLKNYVGTRNYYNFTSGRLPGDPSCKRYIMSCECTSPFESESIEFCVIKIKGQSFMLHQIRKMVGLAIAIMRKLTDVSILEKTWENERIDIPKAPGLGLMLEETHYGWYNSKYGSDGIHEPIQWKEYDDVVEKFKQDNICANIAKTEREEKSMLQWLETLPHHSYDVRDAGPPTMLPPKQKQADVSANIEVDEQKVNKKNAEATLHTTKTELVKTSNEMACTKNESHIKLDRIENLTYLSQNSTEVDTNIKIVNPEEIVPFQTDIVNNKIPVVASEICEKVMESEIKCKT